MDLFAFYARRTLRIFPVYYGMCFALAAYYTFVNSGSSVGQDFLDDLLIYLTYTGNLFVVGWAIVWSLAAEEQFYLVWPQIEKRASRYFIPIMIVLLAVNQAFNFRGSRSLIAEWLNYPELVDLSIAQVTFTPILLGVIVAHLLHKRSTYNILGSLLSARWTAILCLLLLIWLANLPNDNLSGWHRLAIHMGMASLVAACVFREDHKLAPLLKWSPVVRLGVISYGVYLFHTHAIVAGEFLLTRLGVHQTFAPFVVGLLLSCIVAELSFRCFETPILRIKKRYAR